MNTVKYTCNFLLVFSLIALAFCTSHSKENENEKCDNIVVHPEEVPTFVEGIKGVQEKINYPKAVEKKKIEGTVYLRFIVSKKGNVLNPEVIKGVHELLDKEALRSVKKIKFKPAIKEGKPVCVETSIPITFKLDK